MVGKDGFDEFTDWRNLLLASQFAARGKRGGAPTAGFEFRLGDALIRLQAALRSGEWAPGPYVHFQIQEPKRRVISAAPFGDRVVHHALMQVIGPRFERTFSADSYANRVGKGTHRSVARCHAFSRQFRYVLRMDVRRYFPSIDHAILLAVLDRRVPEPRLREVIRRIVTSGADIPDLDVDPICLPGDDLVMMARPRGLPIGNLTSQFWANCYLDGFDSFVQRGLRCSAYLRYVDDLALFGNDKAQLLDQRQSAIDFLARQLRLQVHERAAQVQPCAAGVPWLGFVVRPDAIKVKSRKVVEATRRLRGAWREWQEGRVDQQTFHAKVLGWISHVSTARSWRLRDHVLSALIW